MIIEMQRYKKGIKQKQPDFLSQAALFFLNKKRLLQRCFTSHHSVLNT